MVVAFGMLMLALLRRVGCGMSAARVLGVSPLASYAHGVFRGLLYELVQRIDRRAVTAGAPWAPKRGVRRRTRNRVLWARVAQAFRRTALPLASHYAVTLALPLVNRAAQSGAFVEHALATGRSSGRYRSCVRGLHDRKSAREMMIARQRQRRTSLRRGATCRYDSVP
jgi:hypothetical protein